MGGRRENLISKLPEIFREVEVNYEIVANSRASPDVLKKIIANPRARASPILNEIRKEFLDKILPSINYNWPEVLRNGGYPKEKVEADKKRVEILFEAKIKTWLEEKKDNELKELPEELWKIDKEG